MLLDMLRCGWLSLCLGKMVCKGGWGKGRELWTEASVSNQGCISCPPSDGCVIKWAVVVSTHILVGLSCFPSVSVFACLCLCQPVSVFVFLSVYLCLSVSLSLFPSTIYTLRTEVISWRNFWYCREERAALEKAQGNAWGLPMLLFCFHCVMRWSQAFVSADVQDGEA